MDSSAPTVTGIQLHEHWLEALDAAAGALEAAVRARTLREGEVAGDQRRLAAERAWLETFSWGTIDPISPRGAASRGPVTRPRRAPEASRQRLKRRPVAARRRGSPREAAGSHAR